MTTTVFSSSVISAGTTPIFTFAASGDSLIVNAGVTLSNQGDSVVYAPGVSPGTGLSNLRATINGTLSTPSNGSAGAFMAYGSSIDLTVGSAGRLETSNGSAVVASYDSSVANHGVIHADELDGVSIYRPTDATVENWGSVTGGRSAVDISSDFTGSATIVNHGRLEADPASNSGEAPNSAGVIFTGGTMRLTNDGTILGHYAAGASIIGGSWDGTDTSTIDNSGTIRAQRGDGILVLKATVNITNEGTIGGAHGSLNFQSRGADTVTNDGHLDGIARLGAGADVYHGENGYVTGAVWGQAGNDLLIGGASADILGGGSGNDTVTGGAGADTLTGSTGADLLSGGTGNDVFRFATAGEATGDAIVASGGALAFAGAGVAGGDRINVSAIDANATLAGSQHFVFGTSHAIGRLWAVDVGDVTHIRGNVAGDAAPEFDLAINDGAGVHASDYASVDFIL